MTISRIQVSRRLTAMVIAGVLCVGLVACSSDETPDMADDAAAADVAQTNANVPDTLQFEAETIDGEAFEGANVAGKPSVFWFWAPWCTTCQGQVPSVKNMQEEFGDDVAIVGVGSLAGPQEIADFQDEYQLDITQLSDPDSAVWKKFGVTAQSVFVVLDAEGNVVEEGTLQEGDLQAAIEKAAA